MTQREFAAGEEVAVARGGEATPARHRRRDDDLFPVAPRVPDADTVVLSKAAIELGAPSSVATRTEQNAALPASPLVQLATRHGLRPAGKRPGFFGYLRQVWRYRGFIAAYSSGQLVAQFSSARLGQIWQVLTPIVNVGIYYLIFGLILNTQRGVDNFIGYLCVGVFIFNFTQSVLTNGAASVTGQLGLVRALMFPRAALPIAVAVTQVQNLLVSMGVLAGIVVLSGDPVTFNWVFLVPTLVLQSLFNVGLGLLVARIGVQVPDVRQLVPYISRTWMYASGVIYSVTVFAEHLPPLASKLAEANPLLIYIALARYSLLASPPMISTPQHLWIMGGAWAVISLVAGSVYFWFGEPDYGRG
ncbi:MAG TPA: ABC transporter permease [Micromonosporaceae bacterium]